MTCRPKLPGQRITSGYSESVIVPYYRPQRNCGKVMFRGVVGISGPKTLPGGSRSLPGVGISGTMSLPGGRYTYPGRYISRG